MAAQLRGKKTGEEQKEKSERKQSQSLHLETVLPYSKEPVKTAKLGTQQQCIPFTLDRTLSQRTSCMVRVNASESGALHHNSFCCSDAK